MVSINTKETLRCSTKNKNILTIFIKKKMIEYHPELDGTEQTINQLLTFTFRMLLKDDYNKLNDDGIHFKSD